VDELRRLRQEIARCQRLIANITDVKTLAQLKEYIEHLEKRVQDLENK
jgi:polyhydroxyalkanoate synthesis regulator phasin